MNYGGELIEQIVHSVMQELNLRQSRTESHAPTETSDSRPLAVGGTVITEEVLTRLEAAGRLIQLSPAAVLTPSGRDYIRRNNVRLVSACVSAAGAARPGAAGLPGAAGRPGSPAVVPGELVTIGSLATVAAAAGSVGWNTRVVPDESAAVELLAKSVGGSVSICCGGEPSLVACRLNRNPAVRAAVVCPTTDIEKLTAAMHPDVLCLDATGWSFVDIRRLLRKSVGAERSRPTSWQDTAGRPSRQGGAT